jgi:GT2 family glycosyltransferase
LGDSLEVILDLLSQTYARTNTAATDNHHFATYNNLTKITVTKAPTNLGFAGGNNHAYAVGAHSHSEYSHFWFLNNDTEVPPDCLSEMLKKFDQPGRKVGMVGSTMVYFHDKKTVQALGGSVYKPWTGTMREIGNGLQWPCPVDEAAVEAQMSYVCGASMLVSAELIRDVGLMQEDYFLFFEEIDWCERARKAGYELAYASQAVVFHKEGAAIGTGTGARRSLLAEYYGMRNKLKVTWRFFPWAMPTVWLISWLQVLRRLMQGRPANAWLMARVLLGLGQRPAT